MFGSKNSELTRKYDSNWFDSISFWLRNRCLVAYSRKPTPANASASTTASEKQPVTTRARPAHGRQQLEQQHERDVEEGEVLQRLLEVARVERLERVEHHEHDQRELGPARVALEPLAPFRLRARSSRGRPEALPRERQHAGRDHHVQRHEQVGGLAAALERDPERQRDDRQHRQQPWPPVQHRRERHDHRQRRRPRPAPASAGWWRRCTICAFDPQLAEQQHRRERRAPRAQTPRGRGPTAARSAPPAASAATSAPSPLTATATARGATIGSS